MNIWFAISFVLVVLAILGVFIRVPVVSPYAFWFAVGAYIVLAGTVHGRA
jgi:ABC-type transport system involved in multi-copper enzyme maturation permease subunit